jgi:mRNA interferase RelE/StbE
LAWKVEFDESSRTELARLDPQTARPITTFLKARVAPSTNPRAIGEALHEDRFGEFWKYRVGDYRVIAKIEDEIVRVLVVRIGHRREVYR